ncbi:MAG TPA: hypothetical protein VGO85_02385 [Caldimonas sp.]|jgi:hypothetical protein|nr:hypothetical protein [Caldimonas sp.]
MAEVSSKDRALRSSSLIGRQPNRRHVSDTDVAIDGTYRNAGSRMERAGFIDRMIGATRQQAIATDVRVVGSSTSSLLLTIRSGKAGTVPALSPATVTRRFRRRGAMRQPKRRALHGPRRQLDARPIRVDLRAARSLQT